MSLHLSSEQLQALDPTWGPVRIIAGAGTGKTTVIAERYRRLVQSGIDPSRIIVMTFTERAAGEMRDRIVTATGLESVSGVGTFHSLALGWLREEPPAAGLESGFRILEGPERWIAMRELMWNSAPAALLEEDRPDDLIPAILSLQERLKQELVSLNAYAAWAAAIPDPDLRRRQQAVHRLLLRYQRFCRAGRLVDFDDLLLGAVRLLETRSRTRQHLVGTSNWVMVDEYQDSNRAQERVVQLLGTPWGNVCVVGDDDQSIYRFRGASRANLEHFLELFPAAQSRTLGTNRRSVEAVVKVAARLIEHDRARLGKELGSAEAGPGRVSATSCGTEGSEAELIATEIREMVLGGMQAGRIAVLVRTRALAEPIARALARSQIPVTNWAGRGFYERPEVRDMVAYLRLLANPSDLISLLRLLQRPPLGLPLELVWEAIGAEPGADPLPAVAELDPAREWALEMVRLRQEAKQLGVGDLLFEVMQRTGYPVAAEAAAEPATASLVGAHIGRFAEIVEQWCERSPDQSLALFLAHLELVLISGVDQERIQPDLGSTGVSVLTIHQAKGLEFEAVFVPSMVEGRLPHRRIGASSMELPGTLAGPIGRAREDHLAEERRLLYVALTRARSRVQLTLAQRYSGVAVWKPSRFLAEMGLPPPSEVATEEAPEEELRAATQIGVEASPVRLSFSSINAYRTCPRSFWYRYRLRIPAPASIEAELGTAVHQVLMEAGQARRRGVELSQSLLDAMYRSAWSSLPASDDRRWAALYRKGRGQLRRLLAGGGLNSVPDLVEERFTAAMDGWELSGAIDRVERSERGWTITDFKTGTALPASRLRRDLQLALYALGARRGLGLSGPIELQIVYLQDGGRVLLDATQELLDSALEAGREVADGVRSGAFEALPQARSCRICPYRMLCPDAM
ncbi:MAG TPA: ATP-dependent DNA helicase [Candidatus Nitrosotalea sp.]|nr:ATP-dependent DNA helicase [Candidatus Nitrosotalea sp.]